MSALLADLYQLTMFQAYLDEGMEQQAVFELFVRKLPAQRNFLVAAGLEQALEFLETLSFSEADIDWLAAQGGFSRRLLEHLRGFRFAGDCVQLADEPATGEPLLQPVMRAGRRLGAAPTLAQARAHCGAQLARLPDALRALEAAPAAYPVTISDALRALAREVDAATP
ncbi:MAG: hypothetical protein KJ011_07950 [Burkholderiaceae bacterium]|nr:hypothetical protein [Burkholderiaceae bacterium]